MRYKTKQNLKFFGLIIILVVTIFAIFGLTNNVKVDEDKVEVKLQYEIGSLTSTGKYKESDKSLYTKELFECQGLKVQIDFDANVEYQIFFYDENENYLISTDRLTESFKEELPQNAHYARLVIYPVFDDNVKDPSISFLNVLFNKYSKQLKVFVDNIEEVEDENE